MDYYAKAKEFHDTFDKVNNDYPRSLNQKEALLRSHFMMEELVEYIYTTSSNELEFDNLCDCLKLSIDQAKEKIINKNVSDTEEIVAQSDALVDLLYYIYGTFVLMNVNPDNIYKFVHQANMNKLFPDGKPHYDKITGKVLKPEDWEGPENKILQEIDKQRKEYHGNK